jgi:hypothetical protein
MEKKTENERKMKKRRKPAFGPFSSSQPNQSQTHAAHEHPASPIRIPHTHWHRHVGLGASPPSLPDGPLWAVSIAMHRADMDQWWVGPDCHHLPPKFVVHLKKAVYWPCESACGGGSWLRSFCTWSHTLWPYKMHGLRPPRSLQYSRTVVGEREREIIRSPPSLLPVVPSLEWWLGRSRRRLCLLPTTRAWHGCCVRAETCSSMFAVCVRLSARPALTIA